MYNSWRWSVIFLSNLMYIINFASFSKLTNNEMGSAEGDISMKDSIPSHFQFMIEFLLPIINLYYTMSILSDCGELTLTYFECLMFLILMTGFVLRVWCYIELGRFFTAKLGIRKDHQLIQTGPYQYLVHPSYLAQMMIVFPYLFLIDAHKLYIMAIIAIYIQGMLTRINMEENMMREHFGNKYDIYITQRWQVVPYLNQSVTNFQMLMQGQYLNNKQKKMF